MIGTCSALCALLNRLHRVGQRVSAIARAIGPSIIMFMTASRTSDDTRSQGAASYRSLTRKCFGSSACSVSTACKLDRRSVLYDETSRKAGCLKRARPV